jgi:hypothetical protein
MKHQRYKGELLHRNSEAFRLFDEKKFPELDKHLKRLAEEAHKRGEIPLNK